MRPEATSVCLGLPRVEEHGFRVGQYSYFCASKRHHYTFVLDTWGAASCWEARYFFFLDFFFLEKHSYCYLCPHNCRLCVRILCPHTLQLCCSSVAAVSCSVAVSAYCYARIRLWAILGLTLKWALIEAILSTAEHLQSLLTAVSGEPQVATRYSVAALLQLLHALL
jgi:hypothetical protein